MAISTTNFAPLGDAPGSVRVQLSNALRPINLHLPRCVTLIHQRTYANVFYLSDQQYMLEVTVEVDVRVQGHLQQHRLEYTWRQVVPAPNLSSSQ